MLRALSSGVFSNSIALLLESILKLYRTLGIFLQRRGRNKGHVRAASWPIADTGSNVQTRAMG